MNNPKKPFDPRQMTGSQLADASNLRHVANLLSTAKRLLDDPALFVHCDEQGMREARQDATKAFVAITNEMSRLNVPYRIEPL